MSETSLRELQPASENPWYKLATDAGKDHADNTRRWNGYMRHLIGEEKATNLKRAEGAPKELPLLSPDEIEQIREDIPDNISLSWISLSGLLFAEAVNFQDFYFPVFVDFGRSRFEGDASFTGSTFGGDASFAASTFSGNASFAGSTFGGDASFAANPRGGNATFGGDASFAASTFGGTATFTASTFSGNATFAASTFGGTADFAGSIFEETADFAGSTFAEEAIFAGRCFRGNATFAGRCFKGPATFAESIFEEEADFTGSTFGGPVNFNNSEYRGETSFQNVTFTVAPRFFATTLHEDTDWTGITWSDKPAAKEEAIQYVRRYDRLALVMNTLKQPDNEHLFFRLSMQAKEVRDGKGISTSLSRFYGLFHYGWGLECALKLWVFHILFGAGCLSVMDLFQRSPPFPDLAEICRKIFMMLAISFSNSHPFLGLHRGPAKSAYASFNTLSGFDIVWGTQIVSGSLLLFFLLLTIRNRFRLR